MGDPCMVIPTLSAGDAKKLFPDLEVKKVPSGKEYLRFTPTYWLSCSFSKHFFSRRRFRFNNVCQVLRILFCSIKRSSTFFSDFAQSASMCKQRNNSRRRGIHIIIIIADGAMIAGVHFHRRFNFLAFGGYPRVRSRDVNSLVNDIKTVRFYSPQWSNISKFSGKKFAWSLLSLLFFTVTLE